MMKTESIDTLITTALVLRTTVEEWDELKRTIKEDFPNISLIFQKASVGPLKIVPKTGNS